MRKSGLISASFLILFVCSWWATGTSAQQQPADPNKTATTPATAPQTADAKPASKPKKVITNDDIASSPYTAFNGIFYLQTRSVNDCDASCFDQVRTFSFEDTSKNPNWRREALQQLQLVRTDAEWQTYLRELYQMHNEICKVQFDKQDEQRMWGNTRNVGAQDIAISEKYDAKTKNAQDDLAAVEAKEFKLEKKFADKPFAKGFATVQANRMRSGFCSQARVLYPQ
jgi:hypothetical protein